MGNSTSKRVDRYKTKKNEKNVVNNRINIINLEDTNNFGNSVSIYNKFNESKDISKNIRKRPKLKRKNKKFSGMKNIIIFVFVIGTFIVVSVPLITFYGPFENVKKNIVGISMSSLNHQYIAKTFLSEKQIEKILNIKEPEAKPQENLSEIETNSKKESFTIEVKDIKGERFKGKLMEIKDPKAVKVGYSSKLGKVGEFTSEIAKEIGAVAAINAGGFTDENYAGTGGIPTGVIMSEGKVIFSDLENNDTQVDMVGLTKDGKLVVGKKSINELKAANVSDAVSFKPVLIVDGNPMVTDDISSAWGIAPRTAIGQKKDGTIVLLVIDGRQASSIGATLKEVQDILLESGVYNASNLDGGSSTTMYYDSKVINTPCDILGERAVPSIFYVK